MAKIRISDLGQGQHPSEVLIGVTTDRGQETLIVDRRSIRNNTLDVGFPVGETGEYFLIELPRETMSGEWRVLVPKSTLIEQEVAA